MKTKRENPYSMLLKEARELIYRTVWPKRRTMWSYTPSDLEAASCTVGIRLYERVMAASQLGYEVHLVPRDGNLDVVYVERRLRYEDVPSKFFE